MKWTSWIVLCFFLVGCGVTTTATATVPTQTFVPLLVLTETPTIIPKPTSTSTIPPTSSVTPTQSITPSASLTPLPTYSAHDSTVKIHQLLLNNGGCRLPCFWGIIPGQTTIEEFQQFVNQFPNNAEWMEHDPGFYTFFYAPPTRPSSATAIFFDDKKIIRAIGIKLETASHSFPLTRLLSEYHMPDKVLIGPHDSGFQMFVLYEHQRMVGQYFLVPNHEYLCYEPQLVTGVITWAEGDDWLKYVNNLFGRWTSQTILSTLKPIDQVTEYDMETFYKQFSTRNRSICMKMLMTNP